MRVLSPTASRLDHIICAFCESGLLISRGPGFARCDTCGLPLLGSALATLRVRSSRAAEAARRSVPLPGVRFGGLAHQSSGRRHTKKGSPMVGYMSVEEQVDADFSRARRRAFLRRISARLRKGRTSNHLACFEEVSNKVGAVGGIRRGRRTVRLADIVGSVSRCSEFDRSFFPLRESARTKNRFQNPMR
jgi:hypothetical protein